VAIATVANLVCNTTSDVSVTVTDAAGLPVPDGTAVAATSTLGKLSSTANTRNGVAVFSLLLGSRDGGTATISANAGGVAGQGSAPVSCTAAPQSTSALAQAAQQAAMAPPPAVAPIDAPAQTIRPPSTGDAGLLAGE
jgi:hypothetical protein